MEAQAQPPRWLVCAHLAEDTLSAMTNHVYTEAAITTFSFVAPMCRGGPTVAFGLKDGRVSILYQRTPKDALAAGDDLECQTFGRSDAWSSEARCSYLLV